MLSEKVHPAQAARDARPLAEYRYAGSFTPPAGVTSPDSTAWAERTVYVYDDGVTDPSTGYQLPSAEQAHLGRVAEVQEWTKSASAGSDRRGAGFRTR